MERDATEQFLRTAKRYGRTKLKPLGKMATLRVERPELFLSKEERHEIAHPWGPPERDEHESGLHKGRPAPLLTPEGRAIRRAETAKAASKRYRLKKKKERENRRLGIPVDNSPAPVQPPG